MDVDLLAIVLGRQGLERGLDDAAAETEDEVEGGFLLAGTAYQISNQFFFSKDDRKDPRLFLEIRFSGQRVRRSFALSMI